MSDLQFAMIWMLPGLLGGSLMGYDLSKCDQDVFNKILSFLFGTTLGTMFGPIMLCAIPDYYSEIARERRAELCMKTS